MNITQIQQLRQKNAAAPSAPDRQMVETHISWVLLDDVFAYKIKKPVKFSFLDFSTLEQRIFYCNRELELNKRYSPAVYLEVVPVRMQNGELFLAEGIGKIVDVAVKMRRLDSTKEMDKMLARNEVTPDHIRQLAREVARFHRKEAPLMHGCQVERLRRDFDDILQIKPTLEKFLGGGVTQVLDQSVTFAHQFLDNNKAYLQQREKNGFVRDLHGDLHSGNIFLTQPPTLFDCIEFDDHLRQIDVLNEIAFLLMDLEVFGRTDLSRLFVELYQKELPCELSAPDEKLLEFYKFYRANVRLKVQALRGDAMDVEKVRKYFDLYQMYLEDLTKDGG